MLAGSREVTPYNYSIISVEFVVYLPYNDTYVVVVPLQRHLGRVRRLPAV